jgi:hypothetical protein
MAHVTQSGVSTTPRSFGEGSLFGVPLGDLGWFASLLMGTAAGFAAFFAATFCGIIGILTYNLATHHAVDLTISYKWIGLTVGLVVLVVAQSYLGTMWVRRHLRRG